MHQAPTQVEALVFNTTILLSGRTTTGIGVPEDIVTSLNAGKRPPIRATVNGYTYRTTIAPMGGRFMLSVSADVRAKAGVEAGDEVEVALELDTEPRIVTVPPEFAQALAADPAAQDFFNTLSYSNKQRFVLSIEGARTYETRQRRIAKAVAMLREERT